MEHQEAITILKRLMNEGVLKAKKKEAVFTAIGVLAWTSLSKARIKAMRDKHEKLVDSKPQHGNRFSKK